MAATIGSIVPNAGFSTGGTVAAINGSGFVAGATVTIGGILAHVISNTPHAITITTPAHAAGAVDVTVTNPGEVPVTLANAFTYFAPRPAPAPAPASPPSRRSRWWVILFVLVGIVLAVILVFMAQNLYQRASAWMKGPSDFHVPEEILDLANHADSLGGKYFAKRNRDYFEINISGKGMSDQEKASWLKAANQGLNQLKEKEDAEEIVRVYQEFWLDGHLRGTVIFYRKSDKENDFGLPFEMKMSKDFFDNWTKQMRQILMADIQLKGGGAVTGPPPFLLQPPGAGKGSPLMKTPKQK